MKKSGEQSKRRLKNFAERNDSQLSRYGDYRSMTQKGGWEEGRGRNLMIPHLVELFLHVSVVVAHMSFLELFQIFFLFLFLFFQ